jgi:hypothetical protein
MPATHCLVLLFLGDPARALGWIKYEPIRAVARQLTLADRDPDAERDYHDLVPGAPREVVVDLDPHAAQELRGQIRGTADDRGNECIDMSRAEFYALETGSRVRARVVDRWQTAAQPGGRTQVHLRAAHALDRSSRWLLRVPDSCADSELWYATSLPKVVSDPEARSWPLNPREPGATIGARTVVAAELRVDRRYEERVLCLQTSKRIVYPSGQDAPGGRPPPPPVVEGDLDAPPVFFDVRSPGAVDNRVVAEGDQSGVCFSSRWGQHDSWVTVPQSTASTCLTVRIGRDPSTWERWATVCATEPVAPGDPSPPPHAQP